MTRREKLAWVKRGNTTNASLWLDKYIVGQESDGKSRWALVDEVTTIRPPDCYSSWFERWKAALDEYGTVCKEADVVGRMAVGLGGDGVLETSISLHRTLGVPYIPGSALKGLASSFAAQRLGPEWAKDVENGAHSILFGTIESAGHVTFFDAMPYPGSSQLFPDVMTVHHGDYYQKENVPPADWNSPNPVPFISANGKYLIAVSGPEEWADAALTILAHALESMGIGAKTSSGYGHLRMEAEPSVPSYQAEIDSYITQVKALPINSVAGSIHGFYERWRDLDAPFEEKSSLAHAIVDKVKEAGREKITRKKSWYKELLETLD